MSLDFKLYLIILLIKNIHLLFFTLTAGIVRLTIAMQILVKKRLKRYNLRCMLQDKIYITYSVDSLRFIVIE